MKALDDVILHSKGKEQAKKMQQQVDMDKEKADKQQKLYALALTLNNDVKVLSDEVEKINSDLNVLCKNLDSLYTKLRDGADINIDGKQELKTNPENDVDNSNDLNEGYEFDVIPDRNISLTSGDLLAWGIPYIPSVPRVHTEPNQQKNIEERQVSDQTYQSLRSVENFSEKITDSDKDQFLMELNTRTSLAQ
jgi:hypothetical protein